jgi:hypothetical protein
MIAEFSRATTNPEAIQRRDSQRNGQSTLSTHEKQPMKPIHQLLLAGLALPMVAHAAPVTWGSVQTITGASDIISTGVTSLAGADFGIATGTTTTVNNGSVDIEFKSLNSGQSAALSNGITVAVSVDWINFGTNGGISGISGTFGAILDRNLGVEPPDSPATATITLSELSNGTEYQIQFFADSTGSNGQNISGSATMNSLPGQFVVGTFTADGTTQELSVTTTSGGFGVANALTISTVVGGGPDTTPPDWIATWPKVDPLSTTSLTVRAQTNETGTAYFVVLAEGATAPSADQVKGGNDSADAPALKSGSLALTANTEATGPVTGLTTDTTYDIWFVAEDGVPNLQASPTMVSISLSNAGVVTWGSVQAITGASDIISSGVTGLAGADFGIAPGTTTTVNNGAVDIEFKSLRSGDSVTLSNGITAAAESAWGNWGSNGSISNVGGTFEQVLDRNIGIETPSPTSATITLSGLTNGTQYQIQFFADSTGGNTQAISGSDSMNSLPGQFVTGTFTANGTSQVLSVGWTVEFAVANALTIGVVSGVPVNPYDTWASVNAPTGNPNDDFDGDGVSNAIEFVLGGDKDTNDLDKLPAVGTSGGDMTFSFVRDQESVDAGVGVEIEVGTDLATWPDTYTVGADTGTSTAGVTVANNLDGTDTVTLTVDQAPDTSKFARLKVDITP